MPMKLSNIYHDFFNVQSDDQLQMHCLKGGKFL